MFRCLPEQGFFFPVFAWHGIFQRKQMARSGLCQLSYTIQTRFTDAVELREWSNQSRVWGVRQGHAFCINQPFFKEMGGLPRSEASSEEEAIHTLGCCSHTKPPGTTAPLPWQQWRAGSQSHHHTVSPSPCGMLWERTGGDLHPRSHFFFTLALPCKPGERENRVSSPKRKLRRGRARWVLRGSWFRHLPWQRSVNYEHLSGRSWLVWEQGHLCSPALWVRTQLASCTICWKCYLVFVIGCKILWFLVFKGRNFLLC